MTTMNVEEVERELYVAEEMVRKWKRTNGL
ncbi:hypothetical protein BD01_1571 [Thermococcus nautili]|uniref:Uncharacterized protein n=1 Tax=Thermococcus nautili TaxID=195522 RepID=W8P310_9EURY|nr:hypothetical protein BD01_1571 [Thermococcus nautili]